MAVTPATEFILDKYGAQLKDFCHRHPIARLELFGSFARGEQNSASDLDFLITFTPGTPKGMAHFAFVDDLERELEHLLGCEVDLVERDALDANPNPAWKKLIFSEAAVLYAAA